MGNLGGNFFDPFRGQGPPVQPSIHGAVRRKLLHQDRIFDDLPRPFSYGNTALMGADLNDAQVHFRAQPAVQFHFLLAVKPPFLQGRKVEKPKIHRLLDLVDPLAGLEDGRYMGLH
jgi:hypothetical protein